MTTCVQIQLTAGNFSIVSSFNCAMINKLVLAGLMWKEAGSRTGIKEGAEEDQWNQVDLFSFSVMEGIFTSPRFTCLHFS